ncbi:ABC transporter substrate-binding protein [Marinobacterium sediminicola]|uniref:NitT/TauT family transport system substrate-binding protein n=1 Tax=Marinobacterium sediminicola TaxID=518898 RepID=A0ABY1RXK0_9GAMM|nr:ABC transporter substrate-binding protein [Marinobacterium sediminicola]ULG67748.1 ABC transporter substrate-binding protein [Marinobacterium sediminicola]SMR71606.1 NitT/TauT family transport system substrate-binding protein [Marinobacterium sediminicola]
MRKLFSILALCLSGWSLNAAASDQVEIGYMPIIPVSQAFLTLEQERLAATGFENPELIQFQNGPAMVQALLAGQLDIAYLGIGPAMVARAKGADIKVVASNIVEQISLVALGELAPYFESGDPATAFSRFAADKGRKPVIATFPAGSVPETVLQYWLRKQLAIDPSQVEIVYQGAAQVQQSLLTGAVDGAAILEPIVSISLERIPEARVVASGSEMFPKQPGAVLVVREALINEQPEKVQALVNVHAEVSRVLREQPETAVAAVQRYVGGGRLSIDVVQRALENSRENFVDDPRLIVEGARNMRDFQAEIGTLKADVDLDQLFDTRFYQSLTQ